MFLREKFYQQPTVDLAKALLGKILVYDARGTVEAPCMAPLLAARIVETEAYLFRNDPACHACKGRTKRNAAMFGPAGRTYVYLIYGIYYCLNIVSNKEGIGEAVLLRALEPIAGLDIMAQNRHCTAGPPRGAALLCNGPGKLTKAFGLTKAHNDLNLTKGPLFVYAPSDFYKEFGVNKPKTGRLQIQSSGRIGITQGQELQLRFYIKDNPCVSRPK